MTPFQKDEIRVEVCAKRAVNEELPSLSCLSLNKGIRGLVADLRAPLALGGRPQ